MRKLSSRRLCAARPVLLCAGALALAGPASALAAASSPLTFVWPTQVGTAGTAIVVLHSTGGGNLRIAFDLKPNATYSVSVYAGRCDSLGQRIAVSLQGRDG